MSSSRILRGDDSKKAIVVSWAATQKSGHAPLPVPARRPGAPGVTAEPDRSAETEERLRIARESGVAEGRAEAEQKAKAQVQVAVDRLGRAVAELAGYRDRLRRAAEQDVVMLAVEIARRVLHREIASDREALGALARAAFEKMNARDLHRIRVHPEHAASVEAVLRAIGSPDRLEVVADRTLEIGGIIFETTQGAYDASVTTQLAEIEKGFAEIVQRRR